MVVRESVARALELAVFTAAGIRRHALPVQGTISLGRSDDNDVQIDDGSVSRRHALLHVGAPLRIEDVGSVNGTRVGSDSGAGSTTKMFDDRLAPGDAVELAVGDVVRLGSALVVVRRRGLDESQDPGAPIVRDAAMQQLYALADRVASAPLSVLLLGETGAGKEVLAEYIHRRSPRAAGPLLRLNCAALGESLLESELFGHEKGAFTSAVRAKPGLLETADKGTVFLDEIGELPPGIQVKLLRVLEDRMVMRVGALAPRPIDVRFISATNRDLAAEVKRGGFREDLLFRINGITLTVPPLRARPAEIEPIGSAFVGKAAAALGRQSPELAPETLAALQAHRWPGNVRELRNVIERAVVLCSGEILLPRHLLLDAGEDTASVPLPPAAPPPVATRAPTEPPVTAPIAAAPPGGGDLRSEIDELERRRIIDALAQCAGNQTQAAALLGMPRRTFVSRLTAYGIRRPRKKR